MTKSHSLRMIHYINVWLFQDDNICLVCGKQDYRAIEIGRFRISAYNNILNKYYVCVSGLFMCNTQLFGEFLAFKK